MNFENGIIVGFDLETTGLSPSTDLPVEVGFAFDFPNKEPLFVRYYVNPEIEISPQAQMIHKISHEIVIKHGISIKACIKRLQHIFGFVFAQNVPIAVMNAQFDLSMIDHLFLNNGLEPIAWKNVIDPLVIVRHCDPDYTGSKNLKSLCNRYGVEVNDFHSAKADALAVAKLARKLFQKFDELKNADSESLFLLQKLWHNQWAKEFSVSLAQRGRQFKKEDFLWPTKVCKTSI